LVVSITTCRDVRACTEADVMTKLEAKWTEATSHIDSAETGLATLPSG
jgi:hypothetical protein